MQIKHYIVETISYDGESIDEIKALDGPFDTSADVEKAFAEIAEDYEDNDEATIDEDNFGIVSYEGNGEPATTEIEVEADSIKEAEDGIADALSDKYGFCVNGCTYNDGGIAPACN